MSHNEEWHQYKFAHPWCEVSQWVKTMTLGERFEEFSVFRNIRPSANGGIHHICKGASARVDVTTNLLAVSMGVHNWLEEKVKPGFVLSCWVKMKKGELEPSVMQDISGKGFSFTIDGDDVRDQCEEFRWLIPLRIELVDWYNKQEGA